MQKSMKQELEMAMKLLEKDIYDKQDGLITLREQLDNVKAINIDIYQKLQVCCCSACLLCCISE